MEFKQIQVKVTTLNKNLFDQMPKCARDDFDNMPVIHGWVLPKGRLQTWFIVTRHDGKLAKMAYNELLSRWIIIKQRATNNLIPFREAHKQFKQEIINKYDHIYL